MNHAQMKIVSIILKLERAVRHHDDLALTRLVKQRAVCSVSPHRVGCRDRPRRLVKAQADEAAGMINLPLRSRCERRL